MVVSIKKGLSLSKIRDILQKIQTGRKRGLMASKYCGVINLKESPLTIQKKMRDEWQ